MSDDTELLQRWAGGDTVAGEEFYRRHFRLVFAFFRGKLDEGVDDLVHETFLTVQRRASTQRGPSARAFLIGIARYELLEHLRKSARDASRFDPEISSMQDLATGPSTAVRRADANDEVREALTSLPLDQQIAIELRYWHEMSMEEIADVQEVAPATVRTRLHRARAALKPLVNEAQLMHRRA